MSTSFATWFLAAPFIHEASDSWLTRFVPNEDGALNFRSIPADYLHDRSRSRTGLNEWRDYLRHGNLAWESVQGVCGPRGVLTCFPQLPITIGMRKRLARSEIPLVAWNFNLGRLYTGARRQLSLATLRSVNRFIVHSRAEITAYSEWLNLPAARFQFVPLQRATRPIEFAEDRNTPFVLSMGSAQRDYRLLFRVLEEIGYPAVVVAGSHALAGLPVPRNVEVRSGLTAEQCLQLVQRARINVVPVSNMHTASGQVTLLDAMMFGRAVVMTACPGSLDYVTNRHDAMLVPHGDHLSMKTTIQHLWEDEALRSSIGTAARRTAVTKFSDEAVGAVMGTILRECQATS